MEPFGKIGAIFSLQLSSRTQSAYISTKKVIAENQCEKYKKIFFLHVSRGTSLKSKFNLGLYLFPHFVYANS